MRFVDCLWLFFFTDTATTEIYTLSLHDALPIWGEAAKALAQLSALAPRTSAPQARSSPSIAQPRALWRSEEHTSELQSHSDLVCRLLLEKKKKQHAARHQHPARDAYGRSSPARR